MVKILVTSILVIFLCSCTSSTAQNVEARLTVSENSDSLYIVNLSIRSTENSLKLGNASFRLEYDQEALYFEEESKEKDTYIFNEVLNNGYLYSVSLPTANELAVNIYNSNEAIIISEEFLQIVSIKFNKLSVAENYKTDFVLTEIYEPGSTIPLSCSTTTIDGS